MEEIYWMCGNKNGFDVENVYRALVFQVSLQGFWLQTNFLCFPYVADTE